MELKGHKTKVISLALCTPLSPPCLTGQAMMPCPSCPLPPASGVVKATELKVHKKKVVSTALSPPSLALVIGLPLRLLN